MSTDGSKDSSHSQEHCALLSALLHVDRNLVTVGRL